MPDSSVTDRQPRGPRSEGEEETVMAHTEKERKSTRVPLSKVHCTEGAGRGVCMESSPAGGENNTPKQQRRGLRCTLSSDVDDPSGLLEPKGNNYLLYTVPSFL